MNEKLLLNQGRESKVKVIKKDFFVGLGQQREVR